MKITIITGLYEPYVRGGAERAVETLVRELKKIHTVSIITTTPWHGMRSLFPRMWREENTLVYRFYPLNVFSFTSINQMPWVLRFFWHCIDVFNIHSYMTVRGILRREKPDLVWTHNIKGIGYTVPAAIRLLGIQHVHTLHDIQLLEPSGLLSYKKDINTPSFFSRFYQICTRFLFGSPNLIVFPSVFLERVYENRGFFSRSKKIILPNPILQKIVSVSHIKERSIPVFFYSGQLEPHKGIMLFLRAIDLLGNMNAKFVFAGSGSLQHTLEEAARHDSRIEYKGFLDRIVLQEYLLESVHFTVLPTLCYENAPLAVVESLSAGVPIIVSDIGGAAEYIEEGKNGYRITAGDVGSLLDVLTRACTMDEYETMRQAAKVSLCGTTPEQYVHTVFSSL